MLPTTSSITGRITYPITMSDRFSNTGIQSVGAKLLDNLSNIVAAYSVSRLLRTDYTGPAFRVRRSSDNTLQDIGFDAQGNLDITALLAFVGAGDGYLSKVFDQNGSALELAQSTDVLQPIIVSAGNLTFLNTRPMAYWAGTGQFLETGANIGLSGDPKFTLMLIGTTSLPSKQVYVSFGAAGIGTGFQLAGVDAGNDMGVGYSSVTQRATFTADPASGLSLKSVFRTGPTGADWAVYQNGMSTTLTAGNNNTVSLTDGRLSLGRWVGGSDAAQMYCSEMILFSADISGSPYLTAEQDVMAYYYL